MSNCFAGSLLLAQTNKAEQKEAISFSSFVSMEDLIYLIFGVFDNTISLSAHHYNTVKCQNARGKRMLVEREVRLATILGIIN